MNDALRVALSDTGHTTESLAERVGVDPKTVGRWLSEGRIPHARHRVSAAEVLGRDVSDIWPDTSRRRDPVWFRPWQEIEREAVALRSFQSVVLPGLLQTEAYARAVLIGAGTLPRADIDRHITARLARQGILRREDPPQFTAVIDEGILRRPVGGPETMREQLAALVEACAEPHVRIHVVPSSVGAYAGLNGPFVIATCPDHRIAGYLDNQVQGQVVGDVDDLAAIMAAWENVRGEALSHWQSVDLIREVAETWS
ncbi:MULTISPECIES: helix-turn-helix transcriptional regulator [Micromonospora]|uniref:XRE family transcriptional regulator n=1 Tax=Micromonospora solifontis TaxID=2487138 RepID=A0ABX9WAE9_9ACTN|nr:MULTISPECIES: helix-turn-helix transcriptional regulator [Micromonospora]NES15731.1 XRE family transcriptional regulator [Micromonospora sp. PPF5-17B]NES39003.1 XRE family transcriptional regulator [Micromonospora solifontis]NES56577.1 XRE family transcriptional regulator [Micromonospora sp. PPF5-6]RNL91971.1 XRE family transcriptional regulator [Micromonospora solifontis]